MTDQEVTDTLKKIKDNYDETGLYLLDELLDVVIEIWKRNKP